MELSHPNTVSPPHPHPHPHHSNNNHMVAGPHTPQGRDFGKVDVRPSFQPWSMNGGGGGYAPGSAPALVINNHAGNGQCLSIPYPPLQSREQQPCSSAQGRGGGGGLFIYLVNRLPCDMSTAMARKHVTIAP